MAKRKPKVRATRTLPKKTTSRRKGKDTRREKPWRTCSPVKPPSTPWEEVPRLVKQANQNAMTAAAECKNEYQALEDQHEQGLNEILAGACAVAIHMQSDLQDWKAFVKLPFWERRKRKPKPHKDQVNALKYVVKYVFEHKTLDRTWKYERGLAFYMKEGVHANDVAAQLKKDGGIDKAVARAAKEDPRRKGKSWPDDSYFDLDGPESDGRQPGTKGQDKKTGDKADPDVAILKVEISHKGLEKVLSMAKGKKARIIVKRIGSERTKAMKFRLNVD